MPAARRAPSRLPGHVRRRRVAIFSASLGSLGDFFTMDEARHNIPVHTDVQTRRRATRAVEATLGGEELDTLRSGVIGDLQDWEGSGEGSGGGEQEEEPVPPSRSPGGSPGGGPAWIGDEDRPSGWPGEKEPLPWPVAGGRMDSGDGTFPGGRGKEESPGGGKTTLPGGRL